MLFFIKPKYMTDNNMILLLVSNLSYRRFVEAWSIELDFQVLLPVRSCFFANSF